MASFEMNHSKRGECDIMAGMGNHSSPLATKSFSDLINGGNQPFCSNSIVFDITEFEDAEPALTNQSFFIQVLDRGIPPGHTWYSDGTAYSWFRLNKTFDIPVTGATLNFLSYYEIETDWDYGYVEVHDLDTGDWYTLPGIKTISTLPEIQDNPNCPAQFEPSAYFGAGTWNAFTGTSAMYVETMDLTAFAGNTIEVYFTYWTDPYVLELGWYIDNIEIPEVGFFDDVESGPGDWTYNGWDIVTPPPPTNGTFLSFSTEYYDSYISGPLNATATSYDVPADTTELGYVFAYAYMHNIETTDITTSKVLVGEGFTSNISVTVVNEGAFTETFNVTSYANETATASQNITLESGNSTTVTLTWDTTGFAYGNYTISAVADTVTGETYTSDNTLANGSVMVTIPGDANGDKIVDIFDIGVISAHWYPGPPVGPLGYDANADINNDGAVDIFDIGITSAHWGQTW
jgi:hypothetical protein